MRGFTVVRGILRLHLRSAQDDKTSLPLPWEGQIHFSESGGVLYNPLLASPRGGISSDTYASLYVQDNEEEN